MPRTVAAFRPLTGLAAVAISIAAYFGRPCMPGVALVFLIMGPHLLASVGGTAGLCADQAGRAVDALGVSFPAFWFQLWSGATAKATTVAMTMTRSWSRVSGG